VNTHLLAGDSNVYCDPTVCENAKTHAMSKTCKLWHVYPFREVAVDELAVAKRRQRLEREISEHRWLRFISNTERERLLTQYKRPEPKGARAFPLSDSKQVRVIVDIGAYHPQCVVLDHVSYTVLEAVQAVFDTMKHGSDSLVESALYALALNGRLLRTTTSSSMARTLQEDGVRLGDTLYLIPPVASEHYPDIGEDLEPYVTFLLDRMFPFSWDE